MQNSIPPSVSKLIKVSIDCELNFFEFLTISLTQENLMSFLNK